MMSRCQNIEHNMIALLHIIISLCAVNHVDYMCQVTNDYVKY